MKRLTSMIICVVALWPTFAMSAEITREITVTGKSEVLVTPDEVVLSVAVEITNESLEKAKQENDRIAEAALKAVRSLGIDEDQVRTDHLRIEPEYAKARSKMITAYRVTNSIVVVLQDIDRLADLMTTLIEAGVNRIDSVEFQSTEFRKHRDEALRMALDAAREKAELMAWHMESAVGLPLSITEGRTGLRPSASNVSQSRLSPDGWATGALAPGQIVIPATVTIIFELVDK